MSEFDRWQTRFSAPGYLFGKEPNAFVKSKEALIRTKAGGKALSIADGEARNGVFIAQCGLDVLSLDFSPTAQEKARKLAAERGVTIRTEIADLVTWQWPTEAFDLIAGIFFQFLTPDLRSKVEEASFAAIGGSPATLGDLVKTTLATYARIIKAANIQAE